MKKYITRNNFSSKEIFCRKSLETYNIPHDDSRILYLILIESFTEILLKHKRLDIEGVGSIYLDKNSKKHKFMTYQVFMEKVNGELKPSTLEGLLLEKKFSAEIYARYGKKTRRSPAKKRVKINKKQAKLWLDTLERKSLKKELQNED